MGLVETYREVKKSIVALVPRYVHIASPEEKAKLVPPIFGTGFIVGDGLIATNDHVIQKINELPQPPETPKDPLPVAAMLFYEIPERGIAHVPLEVLGAFIIKGIKVEGTYYGPARPDLGFLHVKAKGLPAIPINPDATMLQEGVDVATAGFPMGTDLLKAPGWEHQFTPTLQSGIISAILPFPCATPHAFMINIMVQGGASGSPVFLPGDPAVIGILNAGLIDFRRTETNQFYEVPTNISYVVPGHLLAHVLEKIKNDPNFVLPPDTKSLQDILDTAEFVVSNDKRHDKPTARPLIVGYGVEGEVIEEPPPGVQEW